MSQLKFLVKLMLPAIEEAYKDLNLLVFGWKCAISSENYSEFYYTEMRP